MSVHLKSPSNLTELERIPYREEWQNFPNPDVLIAYWKLIASYSKIIGCKHNCITTTSIINYN